jgi:hypothetical protein
VQAAECKVRDDPTLQFPQTIARPSDDHFTYLRVAAVSGIFPTIIAFFSEQPRGRGGFIYKKNGAANHRICDDLRRFGILCGRLGAPWRGGENLNVENSF